MDLMDPTVPTRINTIQRLLPPEQQQQRLDPPLLLRQRLRPPMSFTYRTATLTTQPHRQRRPQQNPQLLRLLPLQRRPKSLT